MRRLQTKQRSWQNLLFPLLLVAASLLAYGNTLKGDFVWDDQALFVEHYERWQWANLKELVTAPDNLFEDRSTGYYRPFPNLTFLLDRYLWEQNPTGYHLTNILFHALTVLAVYWMALLLFDRPGMAFAGALCFAWHPINTECVAWINGRNNILSTLFFVLSYGFYLKFRNKETFRFPYQGLSILAFGFSLLSKEYALTMPLVIVAHEILLGSGRIKNRFRRIVTSIAPYVVVILGYLVARSMLLPGQGIKMMHWETFWMRMLTVPKILSIYFGLLVLPVDLSIHYETSLVQSVLDPQFLITICITIVYCLLVWYLCKRSRKPCLVLVWVVLTLTPVLNVIPLSHGNRFVAERYLYLPAVGFCVLVGYAMASLWYQGQSSKKPWTRPVVVLLACLLLQWYLFGTLNRNVVWRNEVTLWTDVVSREPQGYQPYFNLAVAYRKVGRFDKALRWYEKAYAKALSEEGHGLVLSNMSLVFFLKKDYSKAKEYVEKAQVLIPKNAGVYNLLGDVHFMEGSYGMALEQYDKALALDPAFKRSLLGKGMATLRLGRIEEAIRNLEKAKTEMSNDGKLFYYLGVAYDEKGMVGEAARHYAVYLELLPDDSRASQTMKRLKEMGAGPFPKKGTAPMKSR
jgi:tetratricopeptide (TPR) repeat protein